MTNNKIILGIISVIAIFGFLTIVYMATNSASESDTTVYAEAAKVPDAVHATWSKNNKHILTEFADLQCPACAMFHQYIEENIQNDSEITKNITYVYRHFPLQQHQHAREAAYVAEAAGKQGQFFEMADFLFTNQKNWENSKDIDAYFTKAAQNLKLDMEKFNTDKDSAEVKDRVQSDSAMGNKVAVNSTPTFYLDGKKVEVTSLNDFKKLLQDTAKQ